MSKKDAALLSAAHTMLKASKAAIAAWHADNRNFRRELDGTPDWLAAMRQFVNDAKSPARG